MKDRRIGSTLSVAVCLFMLLGVATFARAEQFLVENGAPRAEIVVAEDAVPLVNLAAKQLQADIEAMSGATLPIVHEPTGGDTAVVLVGRSRYTEQRGIDAGDMAHGGYHMKSGDGWLALVGRDLRYLDTRHEQAREMLRLARKGPRSDEWQQMFEKWYELSGTATGLPYSQYHKMYNAELDISQLDEAGSFNAVVGFLRMQGVRRYMPGELGLFMPEKKTIPLPDVDKTVKPDFPLRYAYLHGARFNHWNNILWQLWMGFSMDAQTHGIGYAFHGMSALTELRTSGGLFAHPRADEPKPDEWYALFGGKRNNKVGGTRQCLSSEGLFEANLRYARALFDIFDEPMVSVNPSDSYTSLCQCPKCQGKSDPSRDHLGRLSDYVWDYVDRVARELYKTHPDRKVVGLSYNTYRLPPRNIERFSPNLIIDITQSRQKFGPQPEEFDRLQKMRAGFLELVPDKHGALMQDDAYRMADAVPTYYMRSIVKDLRSLKGISRGDFIDVYRMTHGQDVLPVGGIRHLNLYVTGRYWWDTGQNLDAVLDEYYDNFFGPASAEMQAFIEFAENNWHDLIHNEDKIAHIRQLMASAQQKVEPESVYGRRIGLIAEYIKPLEYRGDQLAVERKPAPTQKALDNADVSKLVIDGKLDDEFWDINPHRYSGELKEMNTGRKAAFPTTFLVAWADNNMYFGIRCEDIPGSDLRIAATEHDQPSMWHGDVVELLIETQPHRYYQISISPSGAIVDLDREGGKLEWKWKSNVQVATHIGDGYWSIEVQLPVAGEDRKEVDPYDGVAGAKPTKNYPWYFNICRQRPRETGFYGMTFSPTNRGGFHVPERFAKLYVGWR